ncbi:MAG TPA: hypothetical protein PKY35_04215 [Candidatus Hydrogenedentes bacterium]|nr:hypothetical protein [Candidatus Hydrogenedentota bacterium]HOL76211.1 hypothetical protein [Candidatus Hydrogenedentota bacterium]HPO86497.1 hypothetical protein [Candidatus Hydrogenedentota bacterium]
MFVCTLFLLTNLCAEGPQPLERIGDSQAGERFQGRHFSGTGDIAYLQLFDIARRMFEPDPEFQNLPMLYTPKWNGFVEGPTWNAWWIQNSYGTTYCILPFLREPYLTFLQNSHDLWFDQMGDGQRAGDRGIVAPNGSLCDAAAPGVIYYKQGDGRVDIHDWAFEFTAAGLLMQAELLLISRDKEAIEKYLPKLERCAAFIDSRRDPKTNLFLVGPAANLLAPSYAGWRQPDGTFEKAYLTGLSVTFIAALDRLIELEKLAGKDKQAATYQEIRDAVRSGLPQLQTDEGYFIKSLDPDGTRHGVYGAEKHGYFESSPNHDAIAFRVVDDEQARKIYNKIASIPGLRRHAVIIANEPSLDDMYETPDKSIWVHGHWVNGGHWSTCEARMILGYFRLGAYEDARRSFEHILTFARKFRMDNPLTDFGNNVYQSREPINLCYDTFGPAAALLRGLFEYLYTADGVTIVPHIPDGITTLEQHDPVRLGEKRIYLAVQGTGPINHVRLNGEEWADFDATSVRLSYAKLPKTVHLTVLRGEAGAVELSTRTNTNERLNEARKIAAHPQDYAGSYPHLAHLVSLAQRVAELYDRYSSNTSEETYLSAHARLTLESIAATFERERLKKEGTLALLPARSQEAADQSYVDTVLRLWEGLEKVLATGKTGSP